MAVAYYNSIRNIAVIFGSLFSNISLRRFDVDGNPLPNRRPVPLAYANKQAYSIWADRIARRKFTDIARHFPRISYELTGMAPDSSRKVNTMISQLHTHQEQQDGVGTVSITNRQLAPVAYVFDFKMTVWTKIMDEGLQIIEQILPLFAPEVNVKLEELKSMGIINDVKVKFNSLVLADNAHEGLQESRLISWDLSFSVYANIYPPTHSSNIITKAMVGVYTSMDEAAGIIQEYVCTGQDPTFMDPDLSTLEIFDAPNLPDDTLTQSQG